MTAKITTEQYLLYTAFAVALVATLGSLFFSEVQHFLPCILCWYQRSVMYPLVLILAVGILRRDKNVALYVLPLSIVGMAIGIYHNLLYYSILPESVAPCVSGVSCTTRYIQWLGFITIPLLALTAFTIITILMTVYYQRTTKKV